MLWPHLPRKRMLGVKIQHRAYDFQEKMTKGLGWCDAVVLSILLFLFQRCKGTSFITYSMHYTLLWLRGGAVWFLPCLHSPCNWLAGRRKLFLCSWKAVLRLVRAGQNQCFQYWSHFITKWQEIAKIIEKIVSKIFKARCLFARFQEAYDYYSQAIMADPDSALLRSNRSGRASGKVQAGTMSTMVTMVLFIWFSKFLSISIWFPM